MKQFSLKQREAGRLGLHELPKKQRTWLKQQLETHANNTLTRHRNSKRRMQVIIQKIRRLGLTENALLEHARLLSKVHGIDSEKVMASQKIEHAQDKPRKLELTPQARQLFKDLVREAKATMFNHPRNRRKLLDASMVNALNNFHMRIDNAVSLKTNTEPSQLSIQIREIASQKNIGLDEWKRTADEHKENTLAAISGEEHDQNKIMDKHDYQHHMLKLWPIFIEALKTAADPEKLRK